MARVLSGTQFLTGPHTLALSNGGHIASLVNAPGDPEASFVIGPTATADAEDCARGPVARRQ
jgi:poly(3-hydroxyalkanoate) synthetase